MQVNWPAEEDKGNVILQLFACHGHNSKYLSTRESPRGDGSPMLSSVGAVLASAFPFLPRSL